MFPPLNRYRLNRQSFISKYRKPAEKISRGSFVSVAFVASVIRYYNAFRLLARISMPDLETAR